MNSHQDIIVAPATLTGGAIAIIRLSGAGSIELCNSIFDGRKGSLCDKKSHTIHYGNITNGDDVLDDVLVSIFRNPNSYTGEDSVEISCHGSNYIVSEIIKLITSKGARPADAGEFTVRAFLAGRIDLSQAEAVADTIASTSKAQHAMASTQMRGGYSVRFGELRGQLLKLTALLELELDFSEEEVEFADRSHLAEIITSLKNEISQLTNSFSLGNAIKEGVNVAIVGEPNVGKSTLLNLLLNDERAMVSEIAGTTRDLIEEELRLDGILFRFIDTAGVHQTDDKLEQMGIERTHSAIEKAQLIIHLIDAEKSSNSNVTNELHKLKIRGGQKLLTVINKIDKLDKKSQDSLEVAYSQLSKEHIMISAKNHIGIDHLVGRLCSEVDTTELYKGAPIVSNLRHYTLLRSAESALVSAQSALESNLPTDLLCQDIREVLHHIGEITGEITTNDILREIFSKFCIGK